MSTGPTPKTRLAVMERALYACERCGGSPEGGSIHHRKPRGMGGTSLGDINDPENLLLLCGSGTTGCHGWVESHRAQARSLGLLVGLGLWPHQTPFYDQRGRLWLLVGTSKHLITLPHPEFTTPTEEAYSGGLGFNLPPERTTP